ncbi:MAG: outer membrane beta-barrel protein [Candidatus Omnitrophica bacterium]|nr:outer membrane beta-barrel protein [Candidatus Omnitrophota bacterium]
MKQLRKIYLILTALSIMGLQAPCLHAEDKPEGLAMSALGKAGLSEFLDKAGIKIYGYAEGGYMYDATAPQPYAGPAFLAFNNLRNTPIVDKISLNAERTVDPAKKQFDLGFRLEGIWGYDARFIHSNGLGDTQTGRYQLDPLQAYVDMALPYVPVKIRAGKWIELAGFEHFSANLYGAFGDPMRALYSYSYQFFYAEPGTQTGVLGTYVLNPQWTFDFGFTEGWNQSTRNTDGYLDLLGRVIYTPTDRTAVTLVLNVGPEYPIGVGRGLPAGDTKNWWTAIDLVITHKLTDKLSLGTGIDIVNAPHIPGLERGSKQWGGIAGYASYAVAPHSTVNTRLEWFNDSSDGFATGAGTGANYYEATLGVAVKLFPKDKILSNFLFRPEVRYDWSDHAVFAGGDRSQVTLSGDVLFTF